ncbi:pilus assembly protein TadB [Massilia sp. Root351]|jgi:tight adherence protein B|uniref:type II secretion system F family protein n=1 Tax=Massilia sp. Root351 TaxID=1736522 RepID=UPI000709B3AC|nr:type II secretion system F family protein [Massilia sp. Root351]KQV79004.1 pilus assembly protein TadB [Massilia sp. Root351]
MDLVFTCFAVLLFAAVILLIEGAWLWWSGTHGGGARRIARRLELMAARGDDGGMAPRVTILKQRRYSGAPWLEQLLRRAPLLPLAARLDRLLLQSGLGLSVARLLGVQAALLMAAAALPPLAGLPRPAHLLSLAAAVLAPALLLYRARSARLAKLQEQLPEVADFLSRALRAGHSFANVLHMVGNEMPEPIGREFRIAYEEINYGVPMNEALHNLGARIPLTDLRYLVIAVLIQRESGGNLAELLGNISRMVRARLRLLAQIRVLSAEGRMSAWILGLLPLAAMALMSLTSYKYISLLWTDPAGVTLLWYGAAAMLGGLLWMRQLIRIRL